MGLMLGRILDETKGFVLDPCTLKTALLAIDSSLNVRPCIISHVYRDDPNNISTNNNHNLSGEELQFQIEQLEQVSLSSTQLTVSLESYQIISSNCLDPPFSEKSSSSYATCPAGFGSPDFVLPPSAQWHFFDPAWCHLSDYEGNKVLLGEGNFGEIVKATCYGKETVVKKLKAGQRVCRAVWEADMTAYLGSFGVCPILLGVIRASEETFNLPALIMEYVPRADDMHHLMEDRGWTFFRLETLDALAQAANLVEFLHKDRILHNDIKHSNFLMAPNPCYMGREVQGIPPPPRRITPRWPCRFRVYLIDLANASYKGGIQLRMHGGPRRKYSNIAPEVILTHANTSYASDVYSFGVLLRYMAKFRLSHYLREVVRRCTQTIPTYRPSMRQVHLYLELLTEAQASNHDDDGHIPKDAINDVITRVWGELYMPVTC